MRPPRNRLYIGYAKHLWENEESLGKYIAKLTELMAADGDQSAIEWLSLKRSNVAAYTIKKLNKMTTVLAKFKVGSVTNFGNNNHNVQMSPVTNGTDENKSFSLYTPSGKIEMHITNPDCIGFFEPGCEYYVEFRQASAVENTDAKPII